MGLVVVSVGWDGDVKLERLSLFEVPSWPQGQHDVRKGCSSCLHDEDDQGPLICNTITFGGKLQFTQLYTTHAIDVNQHNSYNSCTKIDSHNMLTHIRGRPCFATSIPTTQLGALS